MELALDLEWGRPMVLGQAATSCIRDRWGTFYYKNGVKTYEIFRCPFESEQQWEDAQPGNVVARRIIAELIDSVLFTCYNPYTESWSESKNHESTEKSEYKYQLRKWSECEDMIKVWWLVWGENKEVQVKDKCS